MIDADFTFLNEKLAAHYDIPGVQGEQFRRVQLKDGRRGGLIGHASIQTTSTFYLAASTSDAEKVRAALSA